MSDEPEPRDVLAQPWLSILVPSYNRPEGVSRLLSSLSALRGRADVEFAVHDDSTDDSAAQRIASACARFGGVLHRRNVPPLGAPRNWNGLLSAARGRYLMLLHHDEEIAASTDLPALLQAMKSPQAPTAWLLSCYVVHRPGERPREHFPAGWAASLIRRHPAYLLRRNVIGPPSALILRSDRYGPFDERLRWLVDMEAYYRLLRGLESVRAWPSGGVISHRDARNAITALLAPDLKRIEAQERQLLWSIHGGLPGVSWQLGPAAGHRIWRLVESLLWRALRAVLRLTGMFRPQG